MAGVGALKFNKVFLKLGHECEILADEDEIEKRIPGQTLLKKVERQLVKWILVNEKICKSGTIHLKSHGAIQQEKQRHLRYYLTSIHPLSAMKIGWDIFMMCIMLTQLVLVPLDVAFSPVDTMPFIGSTSFLIIRTLLDLLLCANMGINCVTGYYDESKKEIILQHKEIVKHYFKTTFLVDFVSAVPTHADLFADFKHSETMSIIYKILQAISLLKYLLFFTFTKIYSKLCNIFNVNFYVHHSLHMVLTLLLAWHMLACAQIFTIIVTNDGSEKAMYSNKSSFYAFSRYLYEGSLLIYTSSYGINMPGHAVDRSTVFIMWCLSKFVQIYLLARIMEFLKAKTSPKIKYTQMVTQLIEFMRHKQLPIHTQKRILTYYEFRFQKSYFRENEIMATISGQLRQEIVMQTCKQLVENVEFFKELPLNLLIRIVTCLKSEIYLVNDVVIKAGSIGHCMYFISTGTVAVYTNSGKEVCHLEDGAHFGEIALVNQDAKRVASVIAVEICQLYKLDRKDFVKAIYPYPDLLEKIQKIAADRTERTVLLDKQHKTDIAGKRK